MWFLYATCMFHLLCVAIGLRVVADDYCSISSCANPKAHVMCLYKEDQVSPACTNYQKDMEFSDEEKRAILRAHNNLRSSVATGYVVGNYAPRQYPGLNGADYMHEMVWDKELESFARRWVRQCQGGAKDKCRNTAKDRNVGQLVFEGDWDPSVPVSYHINLAYVDAGPPSMDYPIDVSRAETLVTEEQKVLAQLLWANAERVGCARAVFANNSPVAVPGPAVVAKPPAESEQEVVVEPPVQTGTGAVVGGVGGVAKPPSPLGAGTTGEEVVEEVEEPPAQTGGKVKGTGTVVGGVAAGGTGSKTPPAENTEDKENTPPPWLMRSTKDTYVIVCDYSDGDQMKGPIYQRGRPCVYCHCSTEYAGLCAGVKGLRASAFFLALHTSLVLTLSAS